MIPTVNAPIPAPTPAPAQSAQKSALPQADTARTSAGENAAANVRAETTRAVDAPEQSSVAPRLREQETKERPESVFDELVGPEPTFEESPLERQARVALEPPEIVESVADLNAVADVEEDETQQTDDSAVPLVFEDPPPTPTERAEASFAETIELSSETEPSTIDVAR